MSKCWCRFLLGITCFSSTVAFSDEPIATAKKVITAPYSLAASLNQVRSVLDSALKERGLDPSLIEVQAIARDEIPGHIANGAVNASGRPQSAYNYPTNIGVPIAAFFNQKTLGKKQIDISKEFLVKAIESVLHKKPFQYGDIKLNRPIAMATGAAAGYTKRALSIFTGLPYPKVKELGESSLMVHTEASYPKKSLHDGEFDLIFFPEPLNHKFHLVKDDVVGIATVDGQSVGSPKYPLVSQMSFISYKGLNLAMERKIVQSLMSPQVLAALQKLGYVIEDGAVDTLVFRSKSRPDLYEFESDTLKSLKS